MKLWRRVSAVWLCVLLLVPLLAQPARAAEVYPDKGVSFWKMMSGWVGVRAWKSFLDVGVTEETATEDDWRDAYERYADDLQTKMGTVTVIDGGVRIYFDAISIPPTYYTFSSVFLGSSWSFSTSVNTGGAPWPVSVNFGKITLPFNCTYSQGWSFSFNHARWPDSSFAAELRLPKSGSSGEQISFSSGSSGTAVFYPDANYSGLAGVSGRAWLDLKPISSPDYGIDISQNTRVGSITGSIGYYGDNGNLVVDNKQIFNETTNTFYNPATGETGTVNNWSYDYVDRSYGLELEGGKVGKVVYGDDHATVTLTDSNGNIVTYNYYYMGNGGGSGGDGDGDGEDKDSIWDKLGELLGGGIKAIIGMVEALLSKVLDGLIALVEMMAEKLQVVVSGMLDLFDAVPSLFGGFMEFFAALFAFLPQEILYLLQFGFFAAILIGLIRLLLNR